MYTNSQETALVLTFSSTKMKLFALSDAVKNTSGLTKILAKPEVFLTASDKAKSFILVLENFRMESKVFEL